MGCLVKSTEAARAPVSGQPTIAAWAICSTCKQRFTGLVQLRLAIALWLKHACAAEMNEERLLAATSYAGALGDAGEPAEAARLTRGILDVETRMSGPEHSSTLVCASHLAISLLQLGECAEAVALLRTTLAVRTRTLGADDEGTLLTEGILLNSMLHLGEFAEAKALG